MMGLDLGNTLHKGCVRTGDGEAEVDGREEISKGGRLVHSALMCSAVKDNAAP